MSRVTKQPITSRVYHSDKVWPRCNSEAGDVGRGGSGGGAVVTHKTDETAVARLSSMRLQDGQTDSIVPAYFYTLYIYIYIYK